MPYRTLWYGPEQQEYGPNTVRCNTGKRSVCLACSQMKYTLNITQLTALKYQQGLSLRLTGEGIQTASIHVTQVSGYATLQGKLFLASFSTDDGNFLSFGQT